jgi:hypothetical protein
MAQGKVLHKGLELRYGSVLVGQIEEPFCHQGAWFWLFHPTVVAESGCQERRLYEFIRFCEEWHRRLENGAGPDASEFNTYRDVIQSNLWHTTSNDGAVARFNEAPVFASGDVSWRYDA